MCVCVRMFVTQTCKCWSICYLFLIILRWLWVFFQFFFIFSSLDDSPIQTQSSFPKSFFTFFFIYFDLRRVLCSAVHSFLIWPLFPNVKLCFSNSFNFFPRNIIFFPSISINSIFSFSQSFSLLSLFFSSSFHHFQHMKLVIIQFSGNSFNIFLISLTFIMNFFRNKRSVVIPQPKKWERKKKEG